MSANMVAVTDIDDGDRVGSLAVHPGLQRASRY